ncbi:MAG: hypothetical protein Q7T17_10120 [Microbacterium sp.]|uniref:hypothetical protein n=1 Tax=Microbacterium sp. TaxID=51671 RepID=UPI0027237CC7|nr:hypothetical protein [Microbacterium sp.]MDO8383320.1 hypothetical protein [Microbacterium sp.]|tara:strand:- start:607 stop:828 length:222 start_codon:yes stop_codon:yes gene_type:complete
MSSSREELPEGVIDADPTGGWQSGDTANKDSGEPVAPDAPIEGSEPGQVADPDLSDDVTDESVETDGDDRSDS